MNELIRTFAMQANSHHNNFFDLNNKELDLFLEEFSELLVREAISVCDRKGAYEVMDDIIDHFGVEIWL